MRIGKLLLFLSVLFGGGAYFVFGQAAQIVYDPTKRVRQMKAAGVAEERLIKRNALPKARRQWKGREGCGEDFQIVGAAQGSFTRKNAVQKAFLYEFCQTGNGWANNGLVIMESGRIIAHFVEEGGWNVGLRNLPDINKNGFDELVVETSGGLHQGITGGSITLLEVSTTRVTDLGTTQSFSNECEGEESSEDCDRSYKITVTPGVKPIFYKEKLVNTGDDIKPRWKKSAKPQKFLLNKTDSQFKLLK